MNLEDVKRLVELMVENNLSELDVSDGETKIFLKRGADPVQAMAASGGPPAVLPSPAQPVEPPASPGYEPAHEEEELVDITSPMVGTFYASPSPDSEPFVTVGSAIEPGTPVCIIEAMKVMNEIKAECSGTVQEVCVENAQPVEYGQVLFRVKRI